MGICGREKADMGFWAALLYVSLVALLIKCVASVIQQRGIGGLMANKVSVRKICGVNSLSIRAMKKILEQKGLTVAKICVLCGGPDWPISVLCGVLKINTIQMLI